MNLPDFFFADRLTPISYYSYPSSTGERIFELDVEPSDEVVIQRFNDLKRKCMDMEMDTSSQEDSEPVWEKDVWDNKVVIECKTESGDTIYVGYWDSKRTIGRTVENRYNRVPAPYRQVGKES